MVKLVQKPLTSDPLRRHYQQPFKSSVQYIQILWSSHGGYSTNWIKGIPPPGQRTSRYLALVVSKTDTATIDKWRLRENPSLVSLFEEACSPLMKTVGYISVNGSESLQHNKSKPLETATIPFLRGIRGQEPA